MVAKYLLECIIQQVSGCMVCRTGVTFVSIHASHEVSFGMLWQLLNDVNALVVLTFGVYHVHRLVLAHQDTLVAYLSSHLSIEGCEVQDDLVKTIFFLGYLAILQDVAFVFSIIVAHKLLFALSYFYPVAVFHLCSIAGTVFLFLHFCMELLLVNAKSVLSAYQFCEIKWKPIGIEKAEGLFAIDLRLACFFQLVHGVAQ